MATYDMLTRAEYRLTRNLNNVFWGFITFTGFHSALLGLCGYAVSNSKEISTILVGVVMLIAGSILHLASLMTMNSYKNKLRISEKVMIELETTLNDNQQGREDEVLKSYFYSASKARLIILWSLWTAEVTIGLTLIFH